MSESQLKGHDDALGLGARTEMAEIEERLTELEKRIRADAEKIQALFGDTQGLILVVESLGAAVCAGNKPLLRTVIANLKTFEDNARLLNEHDLTIERVRHSREFFESRLIKTEGGDPV